MNYTSNLNLRQPERSDVFRLEDWNYNTGKIDESAGEVTGSLAALSARLTALEARVTALEGGGEDA